MLQKAITYLKDVRQEMSKVSWPSRKELLDSTVIVLILAGILAVYMFVVDTGLSKIVKLLL